MSSKWRRQQHAVDDLLSQRDALTRSSQQQARPSPLCRRKRKQIHSISVKLFEKIFDQMGTPRPQGLFGFPPHSPNSK